VTGGSPAGAAARTLTVRRLFPCPREEVFEAWTNPDALVTWWAGELAETVSAAVDLRVGGAYRLSMRAGGQVFALEGMYEEVEPPERLVYTWRWDGLDVDDGRWSLVTVEFQDRDGATEVVVTHEGIETANSFEFHQGGWTASLQELGQVLEAGER
jgi:uncharacterized protein YndB with AHSA1/START domain